MLKFDVFEQRKKQINGNFLIQNSISKFRNVKNSRMNVKYIAPGTCEVNAFRYIHILRTKIYEYTI